MLHRSGSATFFTKHLTIEKLILVYTIAKAVNKAPVVYLYGHLGSISKKILDEAAPAAQSAAHEIASEKSEGVVLVRTPGFEPGTGRV